VDAGADRRRVSPAFERNAAPTAAALASVLDGARGTVLEIGAGPGQHAAFYARAFPALGWLPTDPDAAMLDSIALRRAEAGLSNLLPPRRLDAAGRWAASVIDAAPLAAVFAQNVLHVAPWRVAEGLFAGAGEALGRGGVLVLYGPFAEGGRHTGPGNARFDAALRARDPEHGLRDVDDLAALARAAGFAAPEPTVMPADNRLLAFRRG
jgi:SAM-dependent methyltransferase